MMLFCRRGGCFAGVLPALFLGISAAGGLSFFGAACANAGEFTSLGSTVTTANGGPVSTAYRPESRGARQKPAAQKTKSNDLHIGKWRRRTWADHHSKRSNDKGAFNQERGEAKLFAARLKHHQGRQYAKRKQVFRRHQMRMESRRRSNRQMLARSKARQFALARRQAALHAPKRHPRAVHRAQIPRQMTHRNSSGGEGGLPLERRELPSRQQ
jgi:hypothetical protein